MKKQPGAATLDDLDIYFKIFNFISTPIFVKNAEHRFVMVNAAFCEFYNIRREDFLGKRDDELFPKREYLVYRKNDRKILTTGLPDESEEYTTIPGGRRLRVITKKSLLQTSSGEKFVLGIVTDMTEKTALLKKIKESEKRYKSIFNLGSDPSALFRYPELICVDVNTPFLKLFNITRSGIIGRQANHLLSWVDPAEREIYLSILLTERRVDNMEIHMRVRNGPVTPFLISARLLLIDKENYILFSLRDISQLKMTEISLQESETLYKALFNNTPNLILIHYCGVIVFVNKAATDFFDQSKKSIVGQRVSDLFRLADFPAEREKLIQQFTQTTEKDSSVEIEVTDQNGQVVNFLARSAKIKYKGNESVMSILTNITERKNLENLILRKTIEAEENERRRFAADLHDDLGPLLSTINLHLGMLQKSRDFSKFEETLGIFENLLNEVIIKVHRLSHYITPHLIDDYGLGASIKDLADLIENNEGYSVILQSNLHNIRFPKEVELHFFRIISELINNSMKHSRSKKMEIDLSYRLGKINLRYSDHGKGYNIRELLKQSHGMGLNSIIQRVNLMNGHIEFKNNHNKTEVIIQVAASSRQNI